MIQAHELRLGNKYINHADQIQHWGLSEFQWLHLGVPIENIIKSPIPLTPEILEKCGFSTHIISSYATLKKFEIYIEDGIYYYDTFRGSRVKLEYLHQLQNLYFALTGEELEVKL